MKILEVDNGITIIEFDPTKHHMFIVDDNAFCSGGVPITFKDGYIIYKKPESRIAIVEADEEK